MQFYPDNTVEKIEFDQVLEILKEYSISVFGTEYFSKARFLDDISHIRKIYRQIEEYRELREKNLDFPLQDYLDGREIKERLQISNAVLAPDELYLLFRLFATLIRLSRFFDSNNEYTHLADILEAVYTPEQEYQELKMIFDEEGEIADQASAELKSIRGSARSLENQSEKLFKKLLDKYKKQGWISDEEQSVRLGERVISVFSKFKRNINGVIVDLSSTGKTTYIQPNEMIELRNKVFELRQLEKQEIFRICKEQTERIRPVAESMGDYWRVFEEFDLIQAKERLGRKIRGSLPKLSTEKVIILENARHPLLYLKNKSRNLKTVPLSLKLDTEERILVVSGPNAGGKSVCLKTTGITQLMVQAALPVAAESGSVLGIFKKIFVDIGDNQSIENDLSTYSSKLKVLRDCIEHADQDSLFLLDEFGSGTDPQLGGYIGEVVLDKLSAKNAKGIVTTHYSNLKSYADKKEAMLNGSMLFDTNNLTPTYELQTGKPGSSYTFEIIGSLGFDEDFINEAKKKLGDQKLSFDQLLIKLQQESKVLENQKQRIEEKEDQLKESIRKNKAQYKDILEEKQAIMESTRQQAEKYIRELNREFEGMLKSWKEAERDDRPGIQKRIRRKIEDTKSQIQEEKQKSSKGREKTQKVRDEKIEAGDMVSLKDSRESGTVSWIRGNKALVEFEHVKTEVNTDRLVKLEHKKAVKASVKFMNRKQGQTFKPELDLRGKRRDEAISLTEEYLDKALLFKISELRIIHGHGDGILKRSIRELLGKYDFVREFNAESEEYGGDGVTLVSLK